MGRTGNGKHIDKRIKTSEMIEPNIICPLCKGDGKETCNNPDHGFISAMGFHDIGRLGCPCCGHDPNYKVPNGGDCEVCSGSGRIDETEFNKFCEDYNYDDEPERINT